MFACSGSAALVQAEAAADNFQKMVALADRAMAAHGLGAVDSARADFGSATELEDEPPLTSIWGSYHARHQLDLGESDECRKLVDHGLAKARQEGWNHDLPRFQALLARLALLEGADPGPHIDDVREWTSRTGDMEFIIEAHLLSARNLLRQGDLEGALGEADGGLLHAETCGYRLKQIELLVALAEIRLRWPDPAAAIQAARTALDLATAPDCGDAWGEADAAQVWGEAYFANNERDLALRAFTQARDVRQRIEHPRLADTEKWIARVQG